MGKKKGVAWRFFRVEDQKVICKYCAKLYKHANVNKMEKHILSCLKCPRDLKKVLCDTGTGSSLKVHKSKCMGVGPETDIDNEGMIDITMTEAEPELSITSTPQRSGSSKPVGATARASSCSQPSLSTTSTATISSSTSSSRPESRISTNNPQQPMPMLNFVDTMNERQNVSCLSSTVSIFIIQ